MQLGAAPVLLSRRLLSKTTSLQTQQTPVASLSPSPISAEYGVATKAHQEAIARMGPLSRPGWQQCDRAPASQKSSKPSLLLRRTGNRLASYRNSPSCHWAPCKMQYRDCSDCLRGPLGLQCLQPSRAVRRARTTAGLGLTAGCCEGVREPRQRCLDT